MSSRVLLLAALALPAEALAQTPTEVIVERTDARPTLAIGMIVGSTIGLASKIYLSSDTALAVAAGSYNFHPGVSAQADWVFQPVTLLRNGAVVMPLYVGGGGRLSHWEHADHMHTDLAIRAPVGVSVELLTAPIDFFFEAALDVNVASASAAHRRAALTAAIGSRYFF